MIRLLLLATLLATGAAAQTPALESLYGTWQVTRDTTIVLVGPDGGRIEFRELYSSLEIGEGEFTSLSVSVQPGSTGPSAYKARFPVRADGLTLHQDDSMHVDLQPIGERLRVRRMKRDEVVFEELMERAPPTVVPKALRGDWYTILTDDAGVGLDLTVHVEESLLAVGAEVYQALSVENFLLLAREDGMDPSQQVQEYRAYAVRRDGRAVVLTGDRDTMRLVPLQR